jgi:pyridoxamine 5'-phosphate oxidase
MPDFWGGYVLAPEVVEFWQGRVSRLHDRLRYRRAEGGNAEWAIERLAP